MLVGGLLLGSVGSPAGLGDAWAKGKKAEGKADSSLGVAAKITCKGDSSMTVMASDTKLTCENGGKDCENDIPLFAKNCSQNFLEVVKLEMLENDRRSFSVEFKPATVVPPGGVWKEKIPWTTEGALEAVVFFRTSGDREAVPETARGTLQVENPTLAAARKACQACSGEWVGSGKQSVCQCKTKDAGKVCRDGKDCQGVCLFEHYDGDARQVGKCSDTDKLQGCFEIIEKGASKLPVKKPPPRKLATCL